MIVTAKIFVTVLGVVLIILVNWYFLLSNKRELRKKEKQKKK